MSVAATTGDLSSAFARAHHLRVEFQELIRKLYTHPQRLSITAIHEHPKLKRLADELTAQEGHAVRLPSDKQVDAFVRSIAHEPTVTAARSGSAQRAATAHVDRLLRALHPGAGSIEEPRALLRYERPIDSCT